MIYREYDAKTDHYPLLKLLDQMHIEVHQDDLNMFYEANGLKLNGIEGKLCLYLEEGCKIRVAEAKGKLVGFLIYHLIYDVILICRGVYFEENYRKQACLYGIFKEFVRNGLKKIYSQTFDENEPNELRGEKSGKRIVKRKLLSRKDGMNVWENTIGD
jgi:hypothetical protein